MSRKINSHVLIAFCILLLLLCVIGVTINAGTQEGVYISEVCPHNSGVIYDSVGFYHDFVEITNTTEETLNLSGYGLSDDDSDLMKYAFPDIELSSGSSLIIWADMDRAYYDAVGIAFEDESGLYTQFRIKDHEILYLTNPNGTVIDSVRIPQMEDNMSVIRDDSYDRGRIEVSKYYEGIIPVVSKYVEPPTFSALSGYYPEPFELTMSGNAIEILYTVDGSDPAVYGKKYDGPILISDQTDLPNRYANIPASNILEQPDIPSVSKAYVLRAVSKDMNGQFSEDKYATFFVGSDIQNICKDTYTLSIISDPEGLFSERTGICVPGEIWEMNREKAQEAESDPRYAPTNYNMKGRDWRRRARLMLFDKEMKCLYDEDDTINVRGATSRSMLQKGFAIKPIKDGQKVFDRLIPGAGDSLDLRTGGEDEAFLTNFRDVLNSRIVENMDICAQRSLCCQVYLDGEYWGCYNLVDHINTSLIASRYDISTDNINLIKNHEVVSELPKDYDQYQEIEEYVKNNDLAVDDNYDRFCQMVDIDSLIDYYCAEIFFVNHDAYVNNVAMWRTREPGSGIYEDCKWRFLLFDTDESDSIWYDAADKDSFIAGNWMGVDPITEPYFSNLSKNSAFRKKFRDRFLFLLDHDLSYDKTGPIIAKFEEEYTNPMVRSMHRFGKEDTSVEQYKQNVEVVRSFFLNRGKYAGMYLMQHMGD